MPEQYSNEPMLEIYIFETSQLIEQLENSILDIEKVSCYSQEAINEIFRIMHTIKGSSAMMLFNSISTLAHSMEDLFYFLREQKPKIVDCSTLSDLVLEGIDFIKVELQKIKNGDKVDGDCSILICNIKEFLASLKELNPQGAAEDSAIEKQQSRTHTDKMNTSAQSHSYEATIFFLEGCEMENVRAFSVVQDVKEFAREVQCIPENIIDNVDSINEIRKNGFKISVETDKPYDEMYDYFMKVMFLKELQLVELDKKEETIKPEPVEENILQVTLDSNSDEKFKELKEQVEYHGITQNIISVNVLKLDKLMDLVGEMVIAEAMVTQNPELMGLELENFQKAARQLHKITSELQDTVMSIRMVPLAATFHKMHRIVRDMSKKLDKEVELELIGTETEVDKNIIEHISDPLMHLVRNSIDHGIESKEERKSKGKPAAGTITLEAKNSGSDVLIIIKDDGNGLNREKILKKAKEHGLLYKEENEMTDREIYNLIFLPGFSTKDNVSEFSGRGVGMDVVVKNIEIIGGTVSIDSSAGMGSTVTLKIPLTLAIIDGMNVRVGKSRYTIPTTAIKESFRPKESDIIEDPDENEMVIVRGQCYPIVRLHEFYGVKTEITDFTSGILIMVEQGQQSFCIFADELLGQQQVVVKALPNYIKNIKKIPGLTGCTLLGDGNISLIIDISGLTL